MPSASEFLGLPKPQSASEFLGPPQDTSSPLARLWHAVEAGFTGAAHSVGNIGYGAAQLATRPIAALGGPDWRGSVDDAAKAREQAYQQNPLVQQHPWASTAGEIAGDALATAPLMALPGAGEAAGAGIVGRLAGAAAAGAGAGALSPAVGNEDYWTQKEKQMALGAAGGAGAAGAGSAIAGAIAPRLAGDAATLAGKGVQLTPAQMVRGAAMGRAARNIESRMQSFPILGDFIRNMRQHNITSFNRATINQALEPIGASLPKGVPAGHDAIKTAGDAISQAYNSVLGRIPRITADPDLVTHLKAIAYDATQRPAVWRDFKGDLNRVLQKTRTGTMTGSELQKTASELERVARGMQGSQDFAQREVARHLRQVRSALYDAAERQFPAEAPKIKSANAAWAMLVRIENAAARRSGSSGVFTPMDLLQAVKQGASGVRRREFARGDALMQNWAEAGQRILPSQIPDSGTAERIGYGALGLGLLGGEGLHDPMMAARIAGAGGAAGLGYRALGAAARSSGKYAGPASVARGAGAMAAPAAGIAASGPPQVGSRGPMGGKVTSRRSVPKYDDSDYIEPPSR